MLSDIGEALVIEAEGESCPCRGLRSASGDGGGERIFDASVSVSDADEMACLAEISISRERNGTKVGIGRRPDDLGKMEKRLLSATVGALESRSPTFIQLEGVATRLPL
jgi:hypothetical protein